jgi:iron complex outermembrane receptor protein
MRPQGVGSKHRPREPGGDNAAVKHACLVLLLAATAAWSQTPAADPAPPAPPASAVQRVEITGGRESDTDQRRRSTAAKIVIGREEIEQFGDSNASEVLRRLPGITTPGRPGRGGPPRMRGLGSGYTQILLDGQAMPRGFALEDLPPDQIERIEILRAPSAETGARAIAGTINIVLREGYRQRHNDLKLGVGVEAGDVSPGLNWSHNDNVGTLAYTLAAGAFQRRSSNDSEVLTTITGAQPQSSRELRDSQDLRRGLNLSARLQWRLGDTGDLLILSPSVFHSTNRSDGSTSRDQQGGAQVFDSAITGGDSTFTASRLNGQWRQRLNDSVRAELGGTVGAWQADNRSLRTSLLDATAKLRDDSSRSNEDNLQLNGKLNFLLGGDEARPGSEHAVVTGGEFETVRRNDRRTLLQNGVPQLSDFGDDVQASSTRAAAFVQDEWSPSPQWSLSLGLRWEGIRTVGDPGDGSHPENLSSVWTPLAHAVWKPDPRSRSQVRLSLTRSWRAPALANLIARPNPSPLYPLDGPNTATQPDRAGNPLLVPELATGVDLALEHYPSGGGVFSASLFQRSIRNLMRSVTGLETVSWSPVPRWVSRTRNVGDATTQGLELEAKGRLDQWQGGAPRVDLRLSVSFFNSRVDGVPGPDNRLDQQAKATANLGADYQVPALPLKLGGNLNWVPAYATQIDDQQRVSVSLRRVVDIYAVWNFSSDVALRLSAGNLMPLRSDDVNQVTAADGSVTTTRTLAPSDVNWQLRLELRL